MATDAAASPLVPPAAAAAGHDGAGSADRSARASRPGRSGAAALGRAVVDLGPFLGYLAVFLLLPTVIVAVGAFRDSSGAFTLTNLSRLVEPNVRSAMGTSVLVSAASALIGTAVGGAAAYSLVVLSEHPPVLRRTVLALCSVLAQFGGVMLAFAFIATVGINGVLTKILAATVHATVDPAWLSTLPGLIVVYSYFQIPLMVITFMPAIEGLRPQWREAAESLGGTTAQYWTRVAGPILAPSILGNFLLLFANAFSSFATAAALFSQREILVPLMIQGALRNELDTGQNSLAQVLAMAMIVIVAVIMAISSLLQRRTSRWQ